MWLGVSVFMSLSTSEWRDGGRSSLRSSHCCNITLAECFQELEEHKKELYEGSWLEHSAWRLEPFPVEWNPSNKRSAWEKQYESHWEGEGLDSLCHRSRISSWCVGTVDPGYRRCCGVLLKLPLQDRDIHPSMTWEYWLMVFQSHPLLGITFRLKELF